MVLDSDKTTPTILDSNSNLKYLEGTTNLGLRRDEYLGLNDENALEPVPLQ